MVIANAARMTAARGRLVAVFVGGGCTVVAGALLYCYCRTPRAVAEVPLVGAASSATGVADDPPADWCAPGFEPIRGGGCFAPASRSVAPLVVYLHGRYSRDAASEELDRQRRLALRASALGFAVLALRGRLGTCTAPELANWYCWPSNETNAGAGPLFVNSWADALAAAQARAGSPLRFLLGFSNGGYFAGLLATRGLLEVDALVVAHGGPVEPVHPLRGTPPLLLLSADDDVAQDEMIRFDEDLTRERWAHDSYARGGGHGLTDQDIDAALRFFSRAREALPLEPALALHRAVRHVRDAGSDVETVDDTSREGGAASPEQETGAGATIDDTPAEPTGAGSGTDVPSDD